MTSQETLKKHYSSLYEDSSGISITHAQKILDLRTSIDNCGKGLKFKCPNKECEQQLGSQHTRYVRQYCGIRICSNRDCRSKRAEKIKAQYAAKLNGFRDPRFLTLTLKDYHYLGRKPLDKLNYAWKRMSKLLRKSGFVRSYIKVIELMKHEYITKKMEYRDVYFYHMHVVYDGVYICADMLRSAWKSFTKDSHWINISRVKRNFSAGAYLQKYLQKLSYDDIDIEEYYRVYKMKLISSYGCKEELETLLEYFILKIKRVLQCPNCQMRLVPDLYSGIP